MDREKINEVLDRYVNMEVKVKGSWKGDYPFWSFIHSARDTVFGEYVEDKSLSFEENRTKEYSFLQDPDKMQEIRAALKAFLHEKDLSDIVLWAQNNFNNDYRISLLRDIKEYMTADEFSRLLGHLMQQCDADFSPTYISKEEFLSWLSSCNPQALMSKADYEEYLFFFPEGADVEVYRGTDQVDDLEPSDCFIWTTDPYLVANPEREGEFFTGVSGFSASVRREDVFGYFPDHDSMVIVNPDKLRNVRDVDFPTEFPPDEDEE